ncbi:hypothetical protein SARC_06562 [Sphaeroforma arctica JP610]|uniref:Uncharacterized protein n=1 Tax=Sphaeroforma arctica JP610 TaxID=667725 RepID=A0A0L0FX34_9EUKA|nr:hypothetical protein SARC_06562 [Sphaeroforma arctica JP610]KNC81101.1 hypothetical protein SARC_06562 [Sphaeroforma arctica JP610]|eukprot:XP_014155003.1 hypothetical protein SARC_06562 [Sphaeroforma arctica JP610]
MSGIDASVRVNMVGVGQDGDIELDLPSAIKDENSIQLSDAPPYSDSGLGTAKRVEPTKTAETAETAYGIDAVDPALEPCPKLSPLGGVCPERDSGWLSQTFYTWMTPMIRYGRANTLEEDHIWKLAEPERSENLTAEFLHLYPK